MTSKVTFEDTFAPLLRVSRYLQALWYRRVINNRDGSLRGLAINMLELGEWIDAPMDTYGDKVAPKRPALEKG